MSFRCTRRHLLSTAVGGIVGSAVLGTLPGLAAGEGGEEIWRYEEPEREINATPTVVDGTVFFRDRNTGTPGGVIYAVDVEDGEKQWEFDVDDLVQSSSSVGSVCVVDGTLHAGKDSVSFALDIEDGSLLWDSEIGGSPVVVGDTAYLEADDDKLYALDASDGSHVWDTDVAAETPIIIDGTLHVAEDQAVYGFDAQDGTELSEYNTGKEVYAPTIAGGVLYVEDGDNVYAHDLSGETLLWETTVEDGFSSIGSLTVYDGTLYADAGGNIHALDTDAGKELYQIDALQNPTRPTIVDGLGIAGGVDGVIGFDTETGDIIWEKATEGLVEAPPIVADGTAYVGDAEGILYAIDVGVSGSSNDSRVLLGQGAHNDLWTGEMPSAGFTPSQATAGGSVGLDSDTEDNSGADSGTDELGGGEADGSGGGEADDEEWSGGGTNADGPGFGVGGALASSGGTAYLLNRRLSGADETFE